MRQVFVYGTLRMGMRNYEKYFKSHGSFRCKGYVKGELHTIQGADYPALICGERMVLGEIHEVPKEVAAELDLLESFFGEGKPENEYDKIPSDIYDARGNLVARLPVYFYNMRNPKNRELLGNLIACDDYIAWKNG